MVKKNFRWGKGKDSIRGGEVFSTSFMRDSLSQLGKSPNDFDTYFKDRNNVQLRQKVFDNFLCQILLCWILTHARYLITSGGSGEKKKEKERTRKKIFLPILLHSANLSVTSASGYTAIEARIFVSFDKHFLSPIPSPKNRKHGFFYLWAFPTCWEAA